MAPRISKRSPFAAIAAALSEPTPASPFAAAAALFAAPVPAVPVSTSPETATLRETFHRLLVEEPTGSATRETKERLRAIMDKLRALGFAPDPEAAIDLFIGGREWTFDGDIGRDADGSFARRWGLVRVSPAARGGVSPELMQSFNEKFGALFADTNRVLRLLVDDVVPKVAADATYRNAKQSTPHAARIAHDRALAKVMLALLPHDIEVYKAWAGNPEFKRFVTDLVFERTMAQARAPLPAEPSASAPAMLVTGAADVANAARDAEATPPPRATIAPLTAASVGATPEWRPVPPATPQAREIAEMEELLAAAGYPPVHAARLQAEGMDPFELESRLKHPPGAVGSLPYTHGIEPRRKAATKHPRELIAPEYAAGDTAAALQASRDVRVASVASTPVERVARHRAAAAVHRAAAHKTSDEARAAHEAAADAHDAVAAAEAGFARATSARNLETTKAGRERTARLTAARIAEAAQVLADAKVVLDLAIERVQKPRERVLLIKAQLAAIKPGTTAQIEGHAVRRVAGDLWLWNILDGADHPADEALPLGVAAESLAVPTDVLNASQEVARRLGYPTSGEIPNGTPLPDAMDAKAVHWINTHRAAFADLVCRARPPAPTDAAPPLATPSPPSGPQASPLTNTTFPGPATLYYQGDHGMAYRRLEVRDVELFFRPYAQYSAAVRVRFTPRGARNQREMWLTYNPKLVILAGHGHPAPEGMWTAAQSAGPGVATQMSRHMAFSEEWEREARDMIAGYVARTGARVLADFHGYDAHRKLTEAELAAWDAVRGDERREAY